MQKERIEIMLPDQPGMCLWDTVVEDDVEYNPACPCLTRTCPNHGFCAYCVPHHASLNRMIGRTTGIPQTHQSACRNFPVVEARELPVGAKVRDTKCADIYLAADVSDGGAVLVARNITDVACLDAAEPQAGSDIGLYGRNDYLKSNLHRWLNSAVTDWYAPAHGEDAPPLTENLRYGERPYASVPGFLTRFSPALRTALTGRDIGGGTAGVFVPSAGELGITGYDGAFDLFSGPGFIKTAPERRVLENQVFPLNPPAPHSQPGGPQNYDPAHGWWYWLRDAHPSRDFLTRVISPYGALTYTYANNDSVGVRPALSIAPGTRFYRMPTDGGDVYVIMSDK